MTGSSALQRNARRGADRVRRDRAGDAGARRRLRAGRAHEGSRERLGESNVAAADPSPPFAEACRARVPGAEVVVAPAEELPFADDAFDAALSQPSSTSCATRGLASVRWPGS